jgi:hypothetical protein
MKRSVIILMTTFLVACLGVDQGAIAEDRVLLGSRHVRDVGDTDTIHVGNDRGAFTGLQVRVLGSAVEFKRVVVHFENGSTQTFEKNRLLRRGDVSRVIDLEGGARYIDKVVFHYEARSVGWRGAEIRLFGVR